MRPVLHGDVSTAARALLHVPAGRRSGLCRRLIAEAEIADRYRRLTGRLHPRFGNGSLMSAAFKYPLHREPNFDHRDYCCCVIQVLQRLNDRRALVRP